MREPFSTSMIMGGRVALHHTASVLPASLVNMNHPSQKATCPHQDPTFKLFGNWGRLF